MRIEISCPFVVLLSVILLFVSPCSLLGGPAPDKWETWSARPGLKPATHYDSKGKAWHIGANDKPSHHGGWDLHWGDIQAGKWYRFDIECHARDLPSVHDNAHAEIFWWKEDGKRAGWKHVRFTPGEPEDLKYYLHAQAPDGAVRATARLMLRWTDRGELAWTSNSFAERRRNFVPADRGGSTSYW